MEFLFSLIGLFVAACTAQSTFSPARPPSLPLAVRSPYLSTWQAAGSDGGNGGYLAGQWPTFWAGAVTGWTGLVRVDGTVYTWMGLPKPLPTVVNQTAFSYTSTRSMFALNAGGVTLNVTFLSPVTPDDLLRQSMPITYLSVEVQSADGAQHDVQLYTDISAEWVSGDRSQMAQWDFGVTGQATGASRRNADAEPQWWDHGPRWHRKRPWPFDGKPSAYGGASDSSSSSSSSHAASNVAATSTPFESVETTSSSTTIVDVQPTLQSASSTTVSDIAASVSSTSGTSSEQSAATSAGASSRSSVTSSTSSSAATGTAYSNGIAYHKVWRQDQNEFSEQDQQASWGYWYYATENVEGLTYQSGADTDIRGHFTGSGKLNNTEDTSFRAINDQYPVFGFSIDLGSVGSASTEAVFTINLAQENAVQLTDADGTKSLPSYWTGAYSNDLSALSFFYGDYSHVSSLTTGLDTQVESDSQAIDSDYATLTSLAVRQAFGSLAIVGDSSTSYIFLKEISSNGDMQTVDVIYPFMPVLLYFNPSWLKLMLDPLYIYQEDGLFTDGTFALHDLGFFPNATKAGEEEQPLEECGNMLIMTLAYAQRTGDTGYLSDHYSVLKQWTDFLVNDSLIPSNQISTDDFAGSLANQTNLALKGMIGIQAMAIIANMTGHASDGANYTSIAADFITQWQTLGIAHDAEPSHTTLAYGQNDTHGLLYNLYADALLQTNLVPTEVYQMQSDFYKTIANAYGVPLDTRHTYTKNDWEMFCAAVASSDTSSLFYSDVAKWINETPTSSPVTDLSDTESGDFAQGTTHFLNRPVVGGWFAPLALNQTGIPSA